MSIKILISPWLKEEENYLRKLWHRQKVCIGILLVIYMLLSLTFSFFWPQDIFTLPCDCGKPAIVPNALYQTTFWMQVTVLSYLPFTLHRLEFVLSLAVNFPVDWNKINSYWSVVITFPSLQENFHWKYF